MQWLPRRRLPARRSLNPCIEWIVPTYRRFFFIVFAFSFVLWTGCIYNSFCSPSYRFDPIEDTETIFSGAIYLSERPDSTLVDEDENLLVQFLAMRRIDRKEFRVVMSVSWSGQSWLAIPKDPKQKSLIILSKGRRFDLAAFSVEANVSARSCISSSEYCVVRERMETAMYVVSLDFLKKVLIRPGVVIVRLYGANGAFTGYVSPDAKACIRQFIAAVEDEQQPKRSNKRTKQHESEGKKGNASEFPVF